MLCRRYIAAVTIALKNTGDALFGSDVSAAATTAIAVFATAQTYNSESVGAGDVLFGDNSAGKANILWDASAGQLLFRGGTTTELYVDTTGSLVAGGGDVTLDSDGLKISAGSGYAYKDAVSWVGSSQDVFRVWGTVAAASATGALLVQGDDGTDASTMSLRCTRADGTGAVYMGLSSRGYLGDYGFIDINALTGGSGTDEVRITAEKIAFLAPTGTVDLYYILQLMGEVSTPSAPSSNQAKLYIKDNGAGKTQLCVLFSSGAEQVLATQP